MGSSQSITRDEFDGIEIQEGNIGPSKAVSPENMTTEKLVVTPKVKGMGGNRVEFYKDGEDQDPLFMSHSISWDGKKAVYRDTTGPIAVVVAEHKLMKPTTRVYKTEPSYEGQEPEDLKLKDPKAKKGEEEDEAQKLVGKNWYLFAESTKDAKISVAQADFRLVTGSGSQENIYNANKWSNMKYHAAIETTDGVRVAKMHQPGMNANKFVLEIGKGVDAVAMTVIFASLFAGGSPVGALVGAGVVG